MEKSKKKQDQEATVEEEAVVAPENEEINKLNEIIKGLEAEKAETNDKYLRTLAEYDNFR